MPDPAEGQGDLENKEAPVAPPYLPYFFEYTHINHGVMKILLVYFFLKEIEELGEIFPKIGLFTCYINWKRETEILEGRLKQTLLPQDSILPRRSDCLF